MKLQHQIEDLEDQVHELMYRLLASTDGTTLTLTPFVHVSFRSPVHWIFFFRSLSLSL
jgi:hypothetical protein